MNLKFLIFFTILTGAIYGQNIKFKTLSTADGMSNNSVNDIVSDKDGVLWIATWDGLNLYDGYNFNIFNHIQNDSTSISSNKIRQLIKDSSGDIWVLTNNESISKYIGNNKFKNYIFKSRPWRLFLSKEGNLIVEVGDIGSYFLFKDGVFTKTTNENIKQNDNAELDNILLSKYPNLFINESLIDSKGNIWYATRNNGLYIIPNTTTNIHNEIVDHYEYDIYSTYSFTRNEIEKLYEDDFGNVWLGHKDGGLSMAYQGSQQINLVSPHPVKNPNLPNETIRAITKDFNSNIWLGYYTQGLFYYSPETKHYESYKISKASENTDWGRIRSLYTTSDGAIWVGTYAGLIRIKGGESVFYSAEDYKNLPNNRNYSFFEDNKKQLWIACWSGLAKFNLNTKKFEVFKGQEKLINSKIRKVTVQENEIILGTENSGVIILNIKTGETTAITTKNGILGNSIYGVFKDEETNYYWISSLGGISIYDLQKGIIKNITEDDALPSHMVYSLILYNGNVWASTTKGIAVVNKNDYSVLNLNPKEGWQAAEFSEGAYYQDRKGTLFFAGINGLNYFHPANINFSSELPNIRVVLDDKNDFPSAISKNYSNNNLKVEIMPISFTENVNNKILYMLTGYDEDWKIYTKNPILYKDLSYGSYTLKIKNSLALNEESKVEIKIKKPFYLTVWFIVLFVFVSGTLIVIWVVDKRRKRIQYQKELEKKIVERTQIINNQRQNLMTTNTKLDNKNKEILKQKEQLLKLHHRFKNEDFEIEKFKTFIFAEFNPLISKIFKNANRLENQVEIKENILTQSGKLINLLLEWDYLSQVKDIKDSKKLVIKLNSVLKVLIENLKLQVLKSKIKFDYTIDVKNVWIELDVLRFKLLFKYLLNSIIKYSSVSSNLKLIITSDEKMISLHVTSDSSVLIDNFSNIQYYGPYFRAVKVLISALNGQLKIIKDETVNLIIEIPAAAININERTIEEVRWNHLNVEEELPSDKNNILVFCNENDYLSAQQILEDEDNNLVFEDSIGTMSSLLKLKNIDSLVLYNTPITKNLIQLLSGIKENKLPIAIPIVYISEQINYLLQEETLELGVDAFIQLPISKSFVQKKLLNLLGTRKTI